MQENTLCDKYRISELLVTKDYVINCEFNYFKFSIINQLVLHALFTIFFETDNDFPRNVIRIL